VSARLPDRIEPGVLGSAIQQDVRLQHAFVKLHALGPRPVAQFVTTLLDTLGVPAAMLHAHLARWQNESVELVRQVGADRWPTPPLDVVPQSEEAAPLASRRRRRRPVLHLVGAAS
jgi:hypothetical protein